MSKKPKENGKKTAKTRNEKGQFVEGNPGGPGRGTGTVSIVTEAKRVLRENPEKLKEIVQDLLNNEKLRLELIRQIDGMPKQKVDVGIEGDLGFRIIEIDKDNGKADTTDTEHKEG